MPFSSMPEIPNELSQLSNSVDGISQTVLSAVDVFKNLSDATDKEVDLFTQINRYRNRIYSDPELPMFWYVFMTTPGINIKEYGNLQIPYLNYLSNYEKDVLNCLSYPDGNNSKPFIYPITNLITGFSPTDLNAQILQWSMTTDGYAQPQMGKDADSQSQQTFTLEFSDVKGSPMLKLISGWYHYVKALSTGVAIPSEEYRKKRKLDYTSTLYYFVTGPDGLFLNYWGRSIGMFPTTVPYSAYGRKSGSAPELFKFSAQFPVAIIQHMRPDILTDFNSIMDANIGSDLGKRMANVVIEPAMKRWDNAKDWLRKVKDGVPPNYMESTERSDSQGLPKTTLTSETNDLSLHNPESMRIRLVQTNDGGGEQYKPAILFS